MLLSPRAAPPFSARAEAPIATESVAMELVPIAMALTPVEAAESPRATPPAFSASEPLPMEIAVASPV